MSEQPRRRRQLSVTDDVPKASQDDSTAVLVEERVTTRVEKSQCQLNKNLLSIACLVSASIYIVIIVAYVAYFVFVSLTLDQLISWKSVLFYSNTLFVIVFVLLTASTFVLDAKRKHTFAIISAAIASILCGYRFILPYIMYLDESGFVQRYGWNHIMSGVVILFPYILLLAFAAIKKKRRNTWIIIGTIVLLFQTVPSLIFASQKWLDFSLCYNSADALLRGLGKWRPGLWFIRFSDLVYGLVFFFGMMSIPKEKRTRNKIYYKVNDYPLLEQYKREHGM